ncbi:TPA: hypothetical protein EYN98_22590 [Candidatus Poribacteria bacterium]|nr:hypothetical protein [Candidatus Poribacteria bacterium]HIA68775.1 hypothetical protein [Candidatus Poribacteria bacterium]HIC02849.1 hypothetical protein [Candidatus Poribacteria bacterium]HIO48878.1 hypothetical protein [Candidatus Poribacteria bacterium]HIO79527.1 hypothetical protein [Candidatus Poribacteria bacterium]
MKIQNGYMVPFGYGKYFRSDAIVGIEPIEQDRGIGRRTKVYVEGLMQPIVASRTGGIILRDILETDENTTSDFIASVQQTEMLRDIMESIVDIPPMLRSIINDQGGWDLYRLEEQMKEMLDETPAN